MDSGRVPWPEQGKICLHHRIWLDKSGWRGPVPWEIISLSKPTQRICKDCGKGEESVA